MSIFAEKRAGRMTGRWIVEVQRNGKPIKGRATSFDEARLLEAQIIAGGDFQKAKAALVEGKTLGWLLEQSAAIWPGKDKQGAKRLALAVSLIGPDLKIEELSTLHLDTLKASLLAHKPARKCDRPISDPNTLNRYLASVSAAIKWARDRKLTTNRPVVPWSKTEEKPKFPFTPEEEQAVCRYLIEQGMPDKALVVRFLSQTGTRTGELAKLRPEHMSNGMLMIGDWRGGTKNSAYREVPIAPALEGAMRDLLARGLPTYRQLWRGLQTACRACGLDERKTLHKLRHATATRLTKAGVNAFTIKKYMGHKSMQTTLGYASVDHEDLKVAAEALRGVGGLRRTLELEAAICVSALSETTLISQGFLEASEGIEPPYKDLQRSQAPDNAAKSLRIEEQTRRSLPVIAAKPEASDEEDTSWIDLLAGR